MDKRIFILSLIASAGLAASAETINISTPATSLIVRADRGAEPELLYYGARLADADVDAVVSTAKAHPAYPVYGMRTQSETALSVRHADGNMALRPLVTSVSRDSVDGLPVTTVHMRDQIYPVEVNLNYRTYPGTDVIDTWVDVVNGEKGELVLDRYASGYLPVRRGDVWVSHLYGSWANEGRLMQEPLQPGIKRIKNNDGARNSHTAHAEIMLSLDGRPNELHGPTIGAALCYGGNYRIDIDTDDSEYHHLIAGINEANSAYHMRRGETFTTPPLALTYSDEGTSGVSRNFHRWGRKYKLAHGDRERKILLNSWEGVYFDINEPGMTAMIDDIASMGGELFVMDDGWFGGKYQRNSDNAALGDWTVDTRKLPGGVPALVSAADKRGIKFGIWIEPEMTNTVSELYEKHPDWVVCPPGRDPLTGRGGTQLVLDMSNPEVQDFVVKVVDDLMTENPGIDYIKWDANMGIQNHGSLYLPADRQSHLYIDWHRGLEDVCRRIRAKYPDLTIQACASGGGRANWGVLPYFDEFWVSDNTDALQRVYMQWGTSYFFPAIAMASHISAAPNHQTFRTIPLKYRIDVAMSGRLGMEIQPRNMTDEEKDLCRRAIARYKEIRPVVQFGDLYRLQSPYDGRGVASLMYVADDKDEAVFYWYKTEEFVNQHLPRVRMAGLDPDKTYRITELNRVDNTPLDCEGLTFSGKYLMDNGLEIPYTHDLDYHKLNDYASRVLRLEAVR
ncbi:MAG: alpha-galactosidase [Bacteroidales bacterium]|nr:alpha-galactosidase [Bacteroidales bacterium]